MSQDLIKEIGTFLHLECDIGPFLLCEQYAATCNVSYNFWLFGQYGRALEI
jgi:hypothetical protein